MIQEFLAMLWDAFVFITGWAIAIGLVSMFFFGSAFSGAEPDKKSQFSKKY